MNQFAKLFGSNSGATSIEYAAIASLVSIVAVATMSTIGAQVAALFATVPTF